METKTAILELRKRRHWSQDELAEKLAVTRQAVSRWENGETVPNTDTLKLMAQIFEVSVDYLLGQPAQLCQSCGMVLRDDGDKGTERDGSTCEEYCAFCYQRGAFVPGADDGGIGGKQSAFLGGMEPGKWAAFDPGRRQEPDSWNFCQRWRDGKNAERKGLRLPLEEPQEQRGRDMNCP